MFEFLAYLDDCGTVRYLSNNQPVLDDEYTLVEKS